MDLLTGSPNHLRCPRKSLRYAVLFQPFLYPSSHVQLNCYAVLWMSLQRFRLRTSCPPIFQPCVILWPNRAKMSLFTKTLGEEGVNIKSSKYNPPFGTFCLSQCTISEHYDSFGRVHICQTQHSPTSDSFANPAKPHSSPRRLSPEHTAPPIWRDRNLSNTVQRRKRTVFTTQN